MMYTNLTTPNSVKTIEEKAQEVMMSFGRASMKGDLIDRFYQIFLASHPTIRPRFQNTDFEKQKALLKQGVNLIIMYAKGNIVGKTGLERIRDTHQKSKMNIPPQLYSYWTQSLLKAISEMDPKFNSELEKFWKEIVARGVEFIIDGYNK